MQKTLSEFEMLCLYGPADAITEGDAINARNRVARLMDHYFSRYSAQDEQPIKADAAAAKSKAYAPPTYVGLERSLPASERESS